MRSDNKAAGVVGIVVGDWAWGGNIVIPHPVIQVNATSVTVGVHRYAGAWLTTAVVARGDIRGVIAAQPATTLSATTIAATTITGPGIAGLGAPSGTDTGLTAATARIRREYLDATHREVLAVLLTIVGRSVLPTPVTAVAYHAIRTLADRPATR